MPEKPISYIVTKVPTNFIYPEIKDEDFRFGSGQLVGTPLRANGDWRDYLPPEEDQNIRGIESSACYVEASQHAIATIEEEQFNEKDNNYSARFNALLSNGTQDGGDPLQGADSMRHDGLVPDSLMPFGDSILSWNDFHSWKGVVESVVRGKGQEYLGKKILGYDIVFSKNESVAPKYTKLKQALQYSPCPVSVTAWYEHDGMYYKPEGLRDNHLVELVYIDEFNRPYIRDTYAPYLKILEPNFNFDFGMRWSVEQKDPLASLPPDQSQSLWNWLIEMILWIPKHLKDKTIPMPQIPPAILPEAQKPADFLTAFCLAVKQHEGYYPGSRSQRNNNPGNCRYSTVGYLPMYLPVGKDPQGFAIFKDYATGYTYLKNLVKNKIQKHPMWNFYTFFEGERQKDGSYIGGYAPSSDDNNPKAYAEAVAKACGVPPTRTLFNLL